MSGEQEKPVLGIVVGSLETLEREAYEACFKDQATYEAALNRLKAARGKAPPQLQVIRPVGGN